MSTDMSPHCETTLVEFENSPPRVGEGERVKSYTIPSDPWGKINFTYSIANNSGQPLTAEVERIISEAFDEWQAKLGMGFSFTQTSGEADITIIFYAGEPHHEKNLLIFTPTTGKNEIILAHAYYPLEENQELGLKGHIHINTLVHWDTPMENDAAESGATGNRYKLKSVVIHEIGHVLGLAHNESHGTVMHKDYGASPGTVTGHDIASIYDLYFHGRTVTVHTPAAWRGAGISARVTVIRPRHTNLGDTQSEETQSEDAA